MFSRFFITAALACVLCAPVAFAQNSLQGGLGMDLGNGLNKSAAEPKVETATHGDWVVACEEGATPRCTMNQVLLGKKDGQEQLVMRVTLAHVPDKESYMAQILVPLGAMVEAGVAIQVDDNEKIARLPIRFCMPEGCYAQALLKPEMVNMFKNGLNGHAFLITPDRKKIAYPVSFKGFTAAMKDLAGRQG